MCKLVRPKGMIPLLIPIGKKEDSEHPCMSCPVYLLLDLDLAPQQVLDDLSTGDIRRPVDSGDIEGGEK
jgi:hypothetical protein